MDPDGLSLPGKWWGTTNNNVPTADVMNQLCRVCGEPAAGFHFGAFTCEGCKSFFGRTYNNLNSVSECKNNGECVINKKNRTSCKACRLRKCLLVGMSKSGSRYGRRSNWFKIHCLLQEQQHQHPLPPPEKKSKYNKNESPCNIDLENNNIPHHTHKQTSSIPNYGNRHPFPIESFWNTRPNLLPVPPLNPFPYFISPFLQNTPHQPSPNFLLPFLSMRSTTPTPSTLPSTSAAVTKPLVKKEPIQEKPIDLSSSNVLNVSSGNEAVVPPNNLIRKSELDKKLCGAIDLRCNKSDRKNP